MNARTLSPVTDRDAPRPYGSAPTARQLKWHALEMYGFIHFTVNTFTDKEWGFGDEEPAVFNPLDFDADSIVETAQVGGLAGLILTCKHHDGFCLWPSRFTEHSVKHSPWRNGKGDVVKALSEACARHGIAFGVYLSPWDRNHPAYGRPEYLAYYRNQLHELMENYGPLFEVWFDGANGGDGYYGGAREKREIDRRTYYDWENTWQIVRDLQPEACMFSDAGPDVRWVGNEEGIAGDPCWATMNRDQLAPGQADIALLNSGQRPGTHWLPAECDVSIRPGWFYHAAEDDRVKSPEALWELFCQSVGRGSSLNLNLPPDRRGRIHERDASSLRAFRRRLNDMLAVDLARGARVSANNTRGKLDKFAPANATNGRRDTYWCTDDSVTTPELILEFAKGVSFNVVSLREYLPLGQRVEALALDAWEHGQWREFAGAASVGNRRLIRCNLVTTPKLRLRITRSPVAPAISEINLYKV